MDFSFDSLSKSVSDTYNNIADSAGKQWDEWFPTDTSPDDVVSKDNDNGYDLSDLWEDVSKGAEKGYNYVTDFLSSDDNNKKAGTGTAPNKAKKPDSKNLGLTGSNSERNNAVDNGSVDAVDPRSPAAKFKLGLNAGTAAVGVTSVLVLVGLVILVKKV